MKTNTSYFHPIFFPTKVAIIDDDPYYLDQISLLINEDVVCDLFTSPFQALSVMQNYEKKNDRFSMQCSHQWESGLSIMSHRGGNINNPHQFIYDDQRFDRFSVMVVDYAMPEMSGVELCKKLQDPWVKKILITGKADLEVAIQAFNQGIIDQFIRKEEDDVDLRLNAAINKLSHQYFTEICTPKNEVLFQDAPYLLKKSFIAWFTGLCKTYNIVEYYLKGGFLISEFLLVNREGELKLLFIQTPEHAKVQYEIALGNELAPRELVDAIYARKIIPYFNGQCVYDIRFKDNWRQHVYEAKQFNEYTYALLDINNLPAFESKYVGYSYNQFFNEFYAEVESEND